MAWYDEAVFYHIYPLGLTGAPKENSYKEPEHRLNTLLPWISHIAEIGCNALYIGPLFESVGHGYETTDYKKLDSRLGTNKDLTDFVTECHKHGIRVILDGVFNHTGRDFFAFQDMKKNRQDSPYKDWYCRVNFYENNEYQDGFTYENWGGYNLLAKLNQHNPAVRDYICDVIRFWAAEFKIDGIRLDAADVLDFGYMQALRQTANEIGPDFWLMGEVIHGDYTRWVNEGTLHSVTNYHLHKALYSGHNDHNYFEIAHTVKRLYGMGGNRPDGLKLYNFVDNHDVERIYTKLINKAHFKPVHILLYTLPGIPSIYYGSEFGIEGKKERYSDDSLRPALSLSDYADALEKNCCTKLIRVLGKTRQKVKALSYGDYKELVLTNRQYAFSRNYENQSVLVAVNNDDYESTLTLPAGNADQYLEVLSGEKISVTEGKITVQLEANSGGIWIPAEEETDLPRFEQKEKNKASQFSKEQKPISMSETPIKKEAPAINPETPAVQKVSDKEKETVQDTSVRKEASPKQATVLLNQKSVSELGDSLPNQKPESKQAAPTSSQKSVSEQEALIPSQKSVSEQEVSIPSQKSVSEQAAPTLSQKSVPQEAVIPNQKSVPEQKVPIPKSQKSYEEMDIAELQEAILEKMAKNGPITDQMRRDVMENVYHNSLINWVKSFR